MTRKSAEVLRTQKRILPVQLTPAEVEEYGSQLAHQEKALEEHELAVKVARVASNKAKAVITARIGALALAIRERAELRQVEVLIQRGKGDLVEEVRADTGEVLGTRRMKEDEAQEGMPFEVPDESDLAS